MALTEAISHLDRGLELVSSLPRSSQRDASELGLRTALGAAWMALGGWAVPEVWSSLHPARLVIWERSGGRVANPYYKYSLTEAMAHLGDLDGAIALIDEVIAQVERPSWGERAH